MSKPLCEHWYTEEIRSYGDDLLVYQCTSCLSRVKPCPDCNLPLNERHAQTSVGCTQCNRGKKCNVKTPLCAMCAPAQDGVCVDCSRPFTQNGRQKLQKKRYCGDACKDRAHRRRIASKTQITDEELPAASEVVA